MNSAKRTRTDMVVGDVVYLKSGGRPMTIIAVNDDGTFACSWDGGHGAFPEASLTQTNPQPYLDKLTRDLEAQYASAAASGG